MNTTNFKRTHFLLLATIILLVALGVPTSYSKYSTTRTYNINIESRFLVPRIIKIVDSGEYDSLELTSPGRYLIIAKGGDGADGRGGSNKNFETPGGLGGTVTAIYTKTTDENSSEYLYLASGTAGMRSKNSNASNNFGAGGTNPGAGKFTGGSGSKVASSDMDSEVYAQNGAYASSGGGGAASVVYFGNTNNYQKVIMIAGGGGAAGSYNTDWDYGFGTAGYYNDMSIVKGGDGGDAGTGGGTSSSTATTVSTGVVFKGNDGGCVSNLAGASNNIPYGLHGDSARVTNSRGNDYANVKQLKSTSALGFRSVNFYNAKDAYAGTDSIRATGNANGTGNGGNASYLGGGGGAGFYGGGGGTGTSISQVKRGLWTTFDGSGSGGGGGGSSYIRTSGINGLNLKYNNFNTDEVSAISAAMTKAANDLPAQRTSKTSLLSSGSANANNAYGNGYIIVYYLGS